MKNLSSILSAIAVLMLVTTVATAQRPNKPPQKNPTGRSEKEPLKPDLAAESIKVKWKDKTTVEVTGTVKNVGQGEHKGARTVTLKIAGADGKSTDVKSETMTEIAPGKTFTITFDTTDVAKYFGKDIKWTLSIYEGDDNKKNDNKTLTLDPGKPPAK